MSKIKVKIPAVSELETVRENKERMAKGLREIADNLEVGFWSGSVIEMENKTPMPVVQWEYTRSKDSEVI